MNFAQKATNIGNRMKKETTSLKESLLEDSQVHVTDEDLPEGISRLVYNHCLNKTEVGTQVFQSTKKTYLKKINDAIESGIITEPIYHNKNHLFTRHSVNTLMDHYNFPKYSDHYKPCAITIQNYKGGTGKSTTALTLASRTALDIDLNARVLLVDLDPQGSAAFGIINVQNPDEEKFITLSDLLCYDLDEVSEVRDLVESGVAFEDIVKAAPFSTHLPNFDVITAFPTDEKFSDLYMELSDEDKQNEFLKRFNTQIMPVLKSQYDIIILDLPPQNSPITWSALEAADGVLMPVSPRTYDYASTMSYLLTIGDLAESLPSKSENINFLKILPVNYNEKEKHERNTYDRLIRTVGSDMIVKPIKHSPLFLEASHLNRTIFDIKPSESTCTQLQYENAISSVNDLYVSFIDEIKVNSVK